MVEDKQLSKLNKLYDEAEKCDKAIFSEQRTNILLKNGEHYKKKTAALSNVRAKNEAKDNSRIRLVKNHIHKVVNIYENSILECNPSVKAMPYNESELHDVKSAEINNSVIKWIKDTNDWEELRDDFVDDFIVEGEVYAKIKFDYDKGNDIAVDAVTGERVRDGEFVIERIMPYDLKRDADAKTMRSARFVIEDVLMNTSDAIDLTMAIDPEKIPQLEKHYKQSKMSVFDSNTGKFKEVRGKIPVRIMYWRPTKRMPNGRIDYFTERVYIGNTELPLGIFPIVSRGFDKLTNSPRSSSIIRVIKPFQVEYNRANSKMAEHQITLGDDRVFIQKGTKLTGGKVKSGVRSFQVSGAAPLIQQGRSGAQYLDYAKDTKLDLYDAANIDYTTLNKQPQGDSYQMLFAAMKDKKKFVKYVNKYGRFEVDIFKLALKMAKQYLNEKHVIKIAGKKEAVNILEFKRMDDNGFEIRLETSNGDIESQFGKMLSLTHVLQYAGSSLEPEQIGQVIKSLPYGNESRALDTLTLKSSNAENLILALDRGEYIQTKKYDDHEFILKALYNRIKSSDFSTLPPEIQEMYAMKIGEQEQFFEMQKREIEQVNMGMIPSGGFLTTVNASWFNPSTSRTERIKIPSEAVQWLVDKLNNQGLYAQELQKQNPQVAANVGTSTGQQPQADQNPAITQGQEIMPQA